MIVTFYSFKGGVGRSMALANVGEILAEWGYRVILCDWDLEAPGLERYFNPVDTPSFRDKAARKIYEKNHNDMLAHDGLMELLDHYKETLSKTPSEQATSDIPVDHVGVGKLILRRPSSIAYVPPTAKTADGDRLRILSAGRREKDHLRQYAEKVRDFDWREFYDRWAGTAYLEFFRKELLGDPPGERQPADIVLVDSRTGVTEQGGVCTHHLADLVVLLGAANEANISGTEWMAGALKGNKRLEESRGGRPLSVLPVISRAEVFNEKTMYDDFAAYFVQELAEYLPDAIGERSEFFGESRIPYVTFYSFRERVVAREPREKRQKELYTAYTRLSHAIVRHGVASKLLPEDRTPPELRRSTTTAPTRRIIRGSVFVSCTLEDEAHAALVTDELKRRGIDVARDAGALPDAATAIFIVGENGMSESMRADLDFVVRRAAGGKLMTIVPLLTGPRVFPSPLLAGYRTYVVPADVRAGSEFFEELVAAAAATPSIAPNEDARPYLGSTPYRESDARYFFGRDDEIGQLRSALAAVVSPSSPVRWLRLEGASGVGVTSLVNAGLLPAIRRGAVRGIPRDAAVVICSTEGDPLNNLAAALASAPAKQTIRAEEILARLEKPAEIVEYVKNLLRGRQTVLVIDSIDALRDQPEKIRSQFHAVLAALLGSADLPLSLVSTGRKRAVSPFDGSPLENAAKSATTIEIGPIKPDRLPEMIVGPATLAGISFETGLAERIATEAAATIKSPAFLAATLLELWKAVKGLPSPVITHAMYEEVGRIATVVTRMAESGLTGLVDPERDIARSMLLRSVSAAQTRLPLTVDVLTGGFGGTPARERVLDKLADLHLIRIDGAAAGLTYDVMLTAPTIATWIREEQIKLRQRAELEYAAQSWIQAGKPISRLPNVGQLAYYKTVETPSVEVAEYLAAAKRINNYMRAGMAVVMIAVAALVLLTPWKQAAPTSTPDAVAKAIIDGTHDVEPSGLLIAATSLNGANADLTKRALRAAIDTSLRPQTVTLDERAIDFDFDDEGKVLAVASRDQIGIYDTVQTKRVSTLTLRGDLSGIRLSRNGELLLVNYADRPPEVRRALDMQSTWSVPPERYRSGATAEMSPDGSLVAVINPSGAMSIYDTQKDVRPRPMYFLPGGDAAKRLLFSPDGLRIVGFGPNGTVWIWTSDGERLLGRNVNRERVSSWAFSPDGKYLVTYSSNGVAARWNVAAGQGEFVATSLPREKAHVAIGPGGGAIAVASRNTVILFSAEGAHRGNLPWKVSGISAARDGRFVVSGEKGLIVIDGSTAKRVRPSASDDIEAIRLTTSPLRAAALLESRKAVQLWDIDAQLRYRTIADRGLLDAAKARLNELTR